MTTEKKTPWEIQKKGTPCFDRESLSMTYISDTLLTIINNLHEYKSYVTGDFIYSLLLGSISKNKIVEQIKLLPQIITIIVEKTLSYIHSRIEDSWYRSEFCFEAIEIFHICCLLDLSQTKKYFETTLSKKNYLFINKIYRDVLESYITKEELDRYKEKYKLLKTHVKYMPDGEGYIESKNHFERVFKETM